MIHNDGESEQSHIRIARMIKNGSLDIKTQENVHKTFSFNVSELALIQKLQNQFGFKDYNETIYYAVFFAAVENGHELI